MDFVEKEDEPRNILPNGPWTVYTVVQAKKIEN